METRVGVMGVPSNQTFRIPQRPAASVMTILRQQGAVSGITTRT